MNKIMKNLKIAASEYEPYMILNRNDKEECEGIACHLIKYIARSMNFTFDLIIQEEIETGDQLPDGNWTGAIGLIQSGVSKSG